MPTPKKDDREGIARIALSPVDDGKYHKLYFIYKAKPDAVIQAGISMLQFNAK
jgi:cytochrome c